MIAYKDFVPKQLRAPRFGFSVSAAEGEHESLSAALAAANEWLRAAGVRMINVETVVLPNMWQQYEEGSEDPALAASGGPGALWYQFIRVWYEEGSV